MALTKQTIKRLRMVKRAILAEPQLYNQADWGNERADVNTGRINVCETPGCIAGWAAWMSDPKGFAANKLFISRAGAHWLGLTEEQERKLFIYWPEGAEDGPAWKNPGTVEAAQQAAQMIERFIRNGGEWGER